MKLSSLFSRNVIPLSDQKDLLELQKKKTTTLNVKYFGKMNYTCNTISEVKIYDFLVILQHKVNVPDIDKDVMWNSNYFAVICCSFVFMHGKGGSTHLPYLVCDFR